MRDCLNPKIPWKSTGALGKLILTKVKYLPAELSWTRLKNTEQPTCAEITSETLIYPPNHHHFHTNPRHFLRYFPWYWSSFTWNPHHYPDNLHWNHPSWWNGYVTCWDREIETMMRWLWIRWYGSSKPTPFLWWVQTTPPPPLPPLKDRSWWLWKTFLVIKWGAGSRDMQWKILMHCFLINDNVHLVEKSICTLQDLSSTVY